MSLEHIQKQLKGSDIAPGSAEEHALLQEARSQREADTDEYTAVRTGVLETAKENGLPRLTPEATQHVAHIAIEQVTGEHRIPVIIPAHADKLH